MKDWQVSHLQLWRTLMSALLLQAFYGLPRLTAMEVSTAAPWMILATGAAALPLVWPVLATLSQRPGTGLIDLALDAGGRPLAIGTALIITGYLVITTGIDLRQVSELANTTLFPHTPQTFLVATMIGAAAMGAAAPFASLTWVGSLFAWPLVIGIIIILTGNVPWGQFRNVMPVTGPGLLPVALQILPHTAIFARLVFLAIFSGYLAERQRLGATLWKSVAVATPLLAAVSLVYLMVFPLPAGLGIPFPLLEMTRLIVGGRFLERLDAIWILFLTFGTAGLMAISLMASATLMKQAFRLPDHRGAVLPLAVVCLATALFPSNQMGALDALHAIESWGSLPALALPLGVALLARIRGGGRGA